MRARSRTCSPVKPSGVTSTSDPTPGQVEQFAKVLWESRDGAVPWEDAGDYWQPIWREIAETAWVGVRRIEGGRHDPA